MTTEGRVLAEWNLKCDSVTAEAGNFPEGEVVCFGPDANFTIMLPDNLINANVHVKSRIDSADATVVWVEDNWPEFDKLFDEIEKITDSPT